MITIAVERATTAAPQAVIDHIWSGAEWQPVPSGIRGLAIEYDDGRHQSVHICVDWGGSYLAMSIMRFRDSATRITFFYSRLQPGVVRQTGIWEARAVTNGCCLRLVRNLELRREPAESAAAYRTREAAHRSLLTDCMCLILDRVTQAPGCVDRATIPDNSGSSSIG